MRSPRPSSDVAFTETVKRIQQERGSRAAYAKMESAGGFESEVTPELVALLARIDTAFLASVNAEGQPYIQHRGGPRGFLRPLDEHTLGFVDLRGNKQYVTTGNLEEDGRVCILAIDYAKRRRVKIWGTARAVPASPDLVERLAVADYDARAEQVVLVTVSAWDVNCPQHIPQKLDAGEVEAALVSLHARIEELEEENRALRDSIGRGPSV